MREGGSGRTIDVDREELLEAVGGVVLRGEVLCGRGTSATALLPSHERKEATHRRYQPQ